MQVREAADLRRLDAVLWGIVLATAIAVGIAALGPFHLRWSTFLGPAAGSAGLMLARWYYVRFRDEPALASALGATAMMAAFSAVGAPLSYIAASAGLPLYDATYYAIDRAMGVGGIDWQAMLRWMNDHPSLHTAFFLAYASFSTQATVTILALAFARHLVRLRVFLLAFFLSALVTIAISAVLPAQGIWGHLGIVPSDHPAIVPATREIHLAIFHGLRDGSFRALMAAGAEGIITFPSLHAALGLIFILALWSVPVLRWIGLAVNVLMIVATPIDGGHYFIDVVAGLLVAAACWALAQRIASSSLRSAVPAWRAPVPEPAQSGSN